MIFPGMDPYLEDPRLWTGVHAAMIVYISDFLQPQLRPHYIAAIEERVYLQGTEQLHETYLTVLDRYAANKIVTVIELVTPANKTDGPGREAYLERQHEVRSSMAHLVEIDLLRTGEHVVACPGWMALRQGPYHYLACVNRAKGLRDEFDLYPRTLSQPLPRIRVPLAGTDADVVLDVQAVLAQTYEHGGYVDRIDYKRPCQPPLSTEDQAWTKKLLKAGPRNGANKTVPKRRK